MLLASWRTMIQADSRELIGLGRILIWRTGVHHLIDLELYSFWLLLSPWFGCLMSSKPKVAFLLSGRPKGLLQGQGSTCSWLPDHTGGSSHPLSTLQPEFHYQIFTTTLREEYYCGLHSTDGKLRCREVPKETNGMVGILI